jgi:exosortase A-associated hydrolase 2
VPTPQTDAFFMPAGGEPAGQRFCLYHQPAPGSAVLGRVVYVHPFTEEMNKSRRMAAMQSRALAQAGYAVLQVDLLGCGDSSGDFGDASWDAWVADVVRACQWLGERSSAPLWLWGLRAGCLLAAQAARQLPTPCNFIFWSPTPSGKTQLQQFLRLKAAGDMLGGGAKGVTEGLRQQLAGGQMVEIAGYALSPGLARGMEQAVLAPPAASQPPMAQPGRLEWLEMSTREDAALSPVAQKAIEQWGQSGFAVRSHIVNGPSFWQTTEIEDAPALVAATLAAVTPLHMMHPVAA